MNDTKNSENIDDPESGLSEEDQKKLDGFSNFLNALNFEEKPKPAVELEPEPEPNDDNAKIVAFEQLFKEYVEPTTELKPNILQQAVLQQEVEQVIHVTLVNLLTQTKTN